MTINPNECSEKAGPQNGWVMVAALFVLALNMLGQGALVVKSCVS